MSTLAVLVPQAITSLLTSLHSPRPVRRHREPFCLQAWHLRNDLDVFLAMEDIVDDFVEENFLRDRPQK